MNNRMQSLREILRVVIIDTVINTLLGRLTLDPAGMHCPSWDDDFVSSSSFFCFSVTLRGQRAVRSRVTYFKQVWSRSLCILILFTLFFQH